MRFKGLINLIIALLIVVPMLPWLAVFPQSPDGAKMLNAAMNNQLFVMLFPLNQGWALSLGSLMSLVGALFFLLQTLTVWNFSWITKFASAIAFAYFPLVWRVALQPERYTWIAFSFCLCFHACSLSFSQKRKRWLFYAGVSSLFLIASINAVFNLDFSQQLDASTAIDGLATAVHHLLQFNFGLLLIFLGLIATMKGHKPIAFLLGSTLLAALAVLSLTRLPTEDTTALMGYMERYPVILIPTLILYYACGLESLLRLLPSLRVAIAAIVVLSLVITISNGREDAFAVNNNLIELFRQEGFLEPTLDRTTLEKSVHACQALSNASKGLPKTSNYFAQDVLQKFRSTIQSAADFLISSQKVTTGDLANQLAASIQPGISPEEWRRLCQAYTARLSSSLN